MFDRLLHQGTRAQVWSKKLAQLKQRRAQEAMANAPVPIKRVSLRLAEIPEICSAVRDYRCSLESLPCWDILKIPCLMHAGVIPLVVLPMHRCNRFGPPSKWP